jgi:predicted MFS family arabinose efflux permease
MDGKADDADSNIRALIRRWRYSRWSRNSRRRMPTRLRGLIALSLVSLAASLVLRGLWGGPWLMEIKALSRIEADNMLGLFTLALIAGPVLTGILDRCIGHRREVLAATHCLAALLLALMAPARPIVRCPNCSA